MKNPYTYNYIVVYEKQDLEEQYLFDPEYNMLFT